MSRSSQPSWQNLPPRPLHRILDHLPIPDNFRFAAVCISWRNVHRTHRLPTAAAPRFASQMPWLIYSKDTQFTGQLPKDDYKRLFYSPSEQRYYQLPLPKSSYKYEVSKHGWLLLVDTKKLSLLIVNPVTRYQTQVYFPPVHYHCPWAMGDMSAPPTDPNCVIVYQFIDVWENLTNFAYRFRDKTWIRLPIMLGDHSKAFGSAIVGGKFYWLDEHGRGLIEIDVDTVDGPLERKFDMAVADLLLLYHGCKNTPFLVECNGNLLLVMFHWTESMEFKRFQVFMADISSKVWVKLESLGEYVLFLCLRGNSFSMLAADTQGPRNRIYFSRNQGPVIEYDYTSHRLVEHGRKGLGMNASKWILPCL